MVTSIRTVSATPTIAQAPTTHAVVHHCIGAWSSSKTVRGHTAHAQAANAECTSSRVWTHDREHRVMQAVRSGTEQNSCYVCTYENNTFTTHGREHGREQHQHLNCSSQKHNNASSQNQTSPTQYWGVRNTASQYSILRL